ncbi:uncharacterized protein KY384_009124 [Bacidia gigantensis]|uniref:uncharacterized protein n=1 Tax=Bacidia gigantensis TaxID=2732470 RepID=UPI001D0440BF|nr:uncharacterized protein KY384_009124 [Bacidia gigantensis]KAG8525480.1 hypothetical protein KY384_009124 [Bacidia gigantensis]
MADNPKTIRPQPLRPPSFTITSSSNSPSPDTPNEPSSDNFISRTRSVLNLTSSTLFGIYAPTDSDRTEPSTPRGNGSQTPAPRASVDEDRKPPVIGSFEKPELRRRPSYPHVSTGSLLSRIGLRTVLLFFFGVAYGVLISHLHDTQQVAPVQVPGIPRRSWWYLIGWGSVAVVLGGLTPWVDVYWEDVLGIEKDVFPSKDLQKEPGDEKDERPGSSRSGLGADWNPLVRSIGAFVGIAFAIRRLPWQSTLQVSLTLALVNPVLWYLVDRSKPGFLLSLIVGLTGTAVVFGVNPEIIPSPGAGLPSVRGSADPLFDGGQMMRYGVMSDKTIGAYFWGPASNFGIPIAAILDTQKDPELISGRMTAALTVYAATFMRYSLAVTPKNYLLFACHFVNFNAQSVQGYRYLSYYNWGGREASLAAKGENVGKEVQANAQRAGSDAKATAQNVLTQTKQKAEEIKDKVVK